MLPIVILAGGLATRLRPITETIPKALVDINGEPFLAHQLRLLKSRGADRVVLCLGYLGEQVRQFAGDGARFGLRIDCVFDGPVLLGTAGAIQKALPLLGENFFVLYGDSYLPCDYARVERAFLASAKQALMTVHWNQGRWDTSNVVFRHPSILAYDKKNRTPEMEFIDYGLGVFRQSAFDCLPEVYDLALLYQDLLEKGELAGLEVPERFFEIGSPAGLEELAAHLSASPGQS